MSIQVTATQGGVTANGILLRVKVLTGVSGSPLGSSGEDGTRPGPAQCTVTTTAPGSMVYGAVIAYAPEAGLTAHSGTTLIDSYLDSPNANLYGTFASSSVTVTPGATVFGTDAPPCSGGLAIAAQEILSAGTIQDDSSAPPVAVTDSATAITSDAFSPPDGALLLALISSDGGIAGPAMAVTGGGLAWNEVSGITSPDGGYAGVWAADAGAIGPDDPTITVTETGGTSQGITARIKVLTGAAPAAAQTGARATQSAAAAHQAAITTTQAGSIVYGAIIDGVNTALTAAAGTTLFDNIADTTNSIRYGTLRTTAATGTPGTVTAGASAPATDVGGCALAEILAATPGGTINEDVSSPVPVTALTSITLQVSVFPPAGSLLALMISSDGATGGVAGMTVSGGGMTWIPLSEAHASGQQYAGVWIADYVVPAIAHDITTAGADFTTTGTQTVSHAAAATARAACVLIDQNGTVTDEVSGVTYGGAAMTRLRSDTEATEAGRTYVYWLDNIAAGTQNVAMTTTAATSKQMVVATMITGGRAVAVAGTGTGTNTLIANPSWTISGLAAGTLLEAYEVIHSGLTTMTATPAAGWTLISSTDLGAQGRGFARQEVGSSGTTLTSGWTAATADDFVGSSVAFFAIPATAVTAVLAAGTGTAQGPVTGATAHAVLASGTGTARFDVSTSVSLDLISDSPVTAAGTALNATISTAAHALLATGSGTARTPSLAVVFTAGPATGTGTAQAPAGVPAALVTGVLAAGAGTALGNDPGVAVAAALALSAGTAAVPGAVPAALAAAGLAAGAGTAPGITASTATSGGATALLATGAGTAQGSGPGTGVTAGLAAGTGTARTAGHPALAGLATSSGTARAAAPAVQARAQAAAALGTALNAAGTGTSAVLKAIAVTVTATRGSVLAGDTLAGSAVGSAGMSVAGLTLIAAPDTISSLAGSSTGGSGDASPTTSRNTVTAAPDTISSLAAAATTGESGP
jgi:hypothetical protein